eukprot:50948_1
MAGGDLFNFCHLNLSIVFTVITSIVILTCSCMVYIFTKNYQKSKEKIKSIRITIGIFTVSTFIVLIMSISIVIRCLFSDTLLISAFAYLWIGMYCTQLYCLSLIFFLRIYHIFKTSIYKLSNKTFKCYISMFILLAILFFCTFILWNGTNRIVTAIMLGLLIFNMVFLNVSLLILFVYKLLLVHRTETVENELENNGPNSFITVITKTTLLMAMSCCVTLINVIINVIKTFYWERNSNILWIGRYAFLCDIVTNFLCVILSYKHMDGYYRIICKIPNILSYACCNRIANSERVAVELNSSSHIKTLE